MARAAKPEAEALTRELARPGEGPTPVTLQSPASELYRLDAVRCSDMAEYFHAAILTIPMKPFEMVAFGKLAAELRKQAAESLALGQERYLAERTTTVKGGLTLIPPQTSRLLKHAQKAVDELAKSASG